jgi:protein-S-isoprenylcysteine O-methyltransferase Ste14
MLLAFGVTLLVTAAIRLKQQLTPLPYPVDEGKLQVDGAYRIVRHPMYSGGVLMAFGWSLLMTSWTTFMYSMVLVVFVDIKSRREERWLMEKYPEYGEYRRRVKKLVPFVY